VVVATRLLMAAHGTGGFAGPVQALRTLSSAPQAGWTQIQDPKAIHYNGSTYVVFAPDTGTSSDLVVGKYVHATQTFTSHVLASAYETPPDNHSSPSVFVRSSDHRIVVAAAHHAEVTSPSIWISTNPEDISAFGSAITPDASIGADQYTYMILYQMASGTIYLFFRDYISGTTTGRLSYSTSTDGGSTWSARTILYTGATGKVPYWRIIGDGDHTIHIFPTDDVPTASPLGHFYLDTATGNRYKSDGTLISASLPIGYSDITQVHAATAWSWGGCVDSLGRPATVMMVDVGSDNAIKVGRFRSGAWQVNTVIASVGGQLTGNQYGSGCAIHHTNPDIVYLARKATKWEMWRYVSLDDGVTWTGTQLTSGSSVDNVWPEVVHNPGTGLEAIWEAGNYTLDTDYDFGIKGWG
jgi:hypothetical protein